MKRILPFLFLFACSNPSPEERKQEYQKSISSHVSYWKDDRTDICFARIEAYTPRATAVPCTEKVLALIEKK